MASVYDAIGDDGFRQLAAAFYARVRADDVLAPLYPDDDWDGAERRLRLFLIFRFGGPSRYPEERGHPRLRMRHAPFPIGAAERDRWLRRMGEAMDACALPEEARAVLEPFFRQTADFMRNRPE